ncbi:MAG: NAD(P)H-quinone oxidoreductase subunit N [Prochlorothrix sp.]|nr:NAD(P)H-quinone oxidoreductase subunit N [Prochlorothrix sp.]
MALFAPGRKFLRDLETAGTLAVYAPLEGGFEGRFQRRLRSFGYQSISLSARGLGDPAMYLTGVHGVRPPHLGKKTIGNDACVGAVYFVPPILSYRLSSLPPKSKGVVLWLIEGQVLSQEELAYFIALPQQDPRIKVVIEMGGHHFFRWEPLSKVIAAA